MSITSAIGSALSGLSVSQRELEVVAGNVANADTPGYARKVFARSAIVAGDRTGGVRAGLVTRELNTQLQSQWRTSLSGGAYAGVMATSWSRLDAAYGGPGSPIALDTMFNAFTGAMEALTTSPDDTSARLAVLDTADALAGRLRSLSADVQTMRNEAEASIDSLADEANTLLQRIADLDGQVALASSSGQSPAALQDQRDLAIASLAEMMDIRVEEGKGGTVKISTASGAMLYDVRPSTLLFDARGLVDANSAWQQDGSGNLGSLRLEMPGGSTVDLFAEGAIRSGSIAAYRELRDETLVRAQAQLDAIAGTMALALSSRTVSGTPATSGAQAGFELDLDALASGNIATLTYTDTATNTRRTVSLVRVDDPAALPLGNDATTDSDDTVIGIDFSGGASAAIADIAAALGGDFAVSDQGGGVVRVLNAGGAVSVDALSARVTETDPASGDTALGLFVDSRDGGSPYTGSFDGIGQKTGFAGRIAVDRALIADPSLLVAYASGVAEGDSTRPLALLDALRTGTAAFDAATGVGTPGAPFTGTLDGFIRQTVGLQGSAAANAARVKEGQDIVVNNLTERFDESREVNIDEEMARLIELQTAYQANARVMQVAQDMIDALIRM